MEEKGHSKVSDLFFGVFVRRNKVHSFEMAKVDVPPQNVYVQKLLYVRYNSSTWKKGIYLADIFLLVVSAETTIYTSN